MRVLLLVAAVFVAGCGSGSTSSDQPAGEPSSPTPLVSVTSVEPSISDDSSSACAHVIDASVSLAQDGTYTVSVTVRSADTGWDKYADRWTVSSNGEVLGERVLTHPHETEQPFTRSLTNVDIPDEVSEVEIAAHDSVAGFCGDTLTVPILR